MAEQAWYLYLIQCRDGSLYAGISVDVQRRYAQHLAGKGARYTRSHPPLRLAAVLRCDGRSEALRAEIRLKRLDVAGKREFCRLHPPPDAPDVTG